MKKDDLISRAAAIKKFAEKREVWYGNGPLPSNESLMWQAAMSITEELPAVDAAPIKPLSVWLAGYAMPPKYTVETNPVDSAKARAEGWEKHIRNLIECGLMEEE